MAMGVGLRPTVKAVEPPPNPKATGTARYLATGIVIGQKSAEVIVGVGRRHPVVWWLETSPDEGRTHPAEGPNAMKDVSHHELLSAMNLYRGAITGRVVE